MTNETLPLVPRVAIPATLAPLTVTVFSLECAGPDGTTIKAVERKFGCSYDVALGLMKDLQGIFTNFFHRLAKVAFARLYDMTLDEEQRLGLMAAVGLTYGQLDTLAPETVSVYVHQFFSGAGEACMTEVLMDRRKHKVGAAERYDAAVKNLADVIRAGGSLDPETFGHRAKDGTFVAIAKGKTTVNVAAINAVLALCPFGLGAALAEYPMADGLVGRFTGDKAYRHALAVNEAGVGTMLDLLHGKGLEPRRPMATTPKGGKPAKRKARGHERLTWGGDQHAHMVAAIHNANTREDGTVHAIGRIRVNLKEIAVEVFHDDLPVNAQGKRALWLTCAMPYFDLAHATETQLGGFHVALGGGRVMFARHGFLVRNRNAGRMIGESKDALLSSDVRLVTVLDMMGQWVVDYIDSLLSGVIRAKKDGGEWALDVYTARRDFRLGMDRQIQSYCRVPGRDVQDDDEAYASVDLLPYQASVEIQETKGSYDTQLYKEQLMRLIHGRKFEDPIRRGVMHEFCVGAAPKGGSFAHVTLMHRDTGRTLMELIGQPGQHNTDRGQREAAAYATAKGLLKPDNRITTIWDGQIEGLTDRCTSLVFAYVCGEGFHFKPGGAEDNPDPVYHTDDGLEATEYVRPYRAIGPMTRAKANAVAVAETGDADATLADLERRGWAVSLTMRPVGTLDAVEAGRIAPVNRGEDTVDAFVEMLTLTTTERLPESQGRKFGWCGTKSVSVHTPGRRYVKVGGRRVYVHVLAAVETVVSKKLEGDLVTGLASLLGHRHFDGTEDVVETEEHLHDMLAAQGCRRDGRFILYDEQGNNTGMCIPALHRAWVMKEDENIATSFKPNGMSRSPWVMNLFGGEITLPARSAEKGQMLADLIALCGGH